MNINSLNQRNQSNYRNFTGYFNLKYFPKIGNSSNLTLNLRQKDLNDSTSSFFNMTKKKLKTGGDTTTSNFFDRNYNIQFKIILFICNFNK